MMFNHEPHRFFSGCITHLVEFEDEEGTVIGATKDFTGPVQNQIKEILSYISTNILKKYTNKSASKAESEIFENYPFLALREAIVNAFHHRGYDDPMPNEIRIYKGFKKGIDKLFDPRRIEIRSFPGPMAPIDERALAQLKILDRRNRNIRLGDLLKQLKLAEKYATGIPQMVEALSQNGSPKLLLSTDKDRVFFLTVIKIHESTPLTIDIIDVLEKVTLSNNQQNIMDKCLNEPHTKDELSKLSHENIFDDIKYLLSSELINSKNIGSSVVYYVTDKGRNVLKSTF